MLARRRAFVIVNDIVERFGLDESDIESTYAKQLLAKGVLTPTEAEVFAGNLYDSTDGTTARETSQSSANGGAGADTRAAAGIAPTTGT